MTLRRLRSALAWAAGRLRPRLLPILQTAAAAVAAYYLAQLLPLKDNRPVFASIAAVISLGASYQQRGRRAAELIAGVVLGLTVADLIIHAIGNGPLQIGLMIVLAMSAAVILGGGELLVSEAAVSALLLASIEPTNSGYSPDRFLEALTGGAVALAVGVALLPAGPHADRGTRGPVGLPRPRRDARRGGGRARGGRLRARRERRWQTGRAPSTATSAGWRRPSPPRAR